MGIDDDMPDELLSWVHEHSKERGTEMVAVTGIIIMYHGLDDEGDSYWNYRIMGEKAIIGVTGLLEAVKLRALTPHIQFGLEEQERQREEDNDD